jgi:hypothetical protein
MALAVLSQLANAAPITYTINRLVIQTIQVGNFGQVTGFITTNGSIGTISANDITSFDIQSTVTDRSGVSTSIHYTNLNGYLRLVSGLEATSDTLSITNLADSVFSIVDNPVGQNQNGWVVSFGARFTGSETVASSGKMVTNAVLALPFSRSFQAELATTSGRQTQGVVAIPASIPVPSSALLIAMGLGLFHRLGRKTR